MRFVGEYLKKCFSSYAVIASCKQISPETKCKGSYHLIVVVHPHIDISALYVYYFESFLFKQSIGSCLVDYPIIIIEILFVVSVYGIA